jgi:hypothetical protein
MSSYLHNYSDKLCMQRKTNGDPCESRALRGEDFCHNHKVMGKPKVNIDNSPTGHTYLRAFNDPDSIQSAISDVCEMMLHRRIEPKEASILLYAMQVASTNMAHMNQEARRKHKRQNNNNNQNGAAEPSSSVAPSSNQAPPTPESTATSSSAPEPLPPGTIQACEQRRRQAFE